MNSNSYSSITATPDGRCQTGTSLHSSSNLVVNQTLGANEVNFTPVPSAAVADFDTLSSDLDATVSRDEWLSMQTVGLPLNGMYFDPYAWLADNSTVEAQAAQDLAFAGFLEGEDLREHPHLPQYTMLKVSIILASAVTEEARITGMEPHLSVILPRHYTESTVLRNLQSTRTAPVMALSKISPLFLEEGMRLARMTKNRELAESLTIASKSRLGAMIAVVCKDSDDANHYMAESEASSLLRTFDIGQEIHSGCSRMDSVDNATLKEGLTQTEIATLYWLREQCAPARLDLLRAQIVEK